MIPLLLATGPDPKSRTARHRRDRRPALVDVLTLILLPILYRRYGGVAKAAK